LGTAQEFLVNDLRQLVVANGIVRRNHIAVLVLDLFPVALFTEDVHRKSVHELQPASFSRVLHPGNYAGADALEDGASLLLAVRNVERAHQSRLLAGVEDSKNDKFDEAERAEENGNIQLVILNSICCQPNYIQHHVNRSEREDVVHKDEGEAEDLAHQELAYKEAEGESDEVLEQYEFVLEGE